MATSPITSRKIVWVIIHWLLIQIFFLPNRKSIERFLSMLGAIGSSIAISSVLTRYSGTALLFPASLRLSVIGTAALIGNVAHEYGRSRHKENHDNKWPPSQPWKVVSVVMLLLVCLSGYSFLYVKCLREFDPTAWLKDQAKVHALDSNLLTSNIISLKQAPDFVNVTDRLIALPIQFPAKIQEQIDLIAREHNVDGVRYVLDNEPSLMMNWLSDEAREQRAYTNLIFLWLHFIIITCAALITGYMSNQGDWVVILASLGVLLFKYMGWKT